MARLILSDIISDIRGTVGTHTYSYWKGVHIVKNCSVNYRTAHESAFREKHNTFIARLSQYWFAGLTQAKRDDWETYAVFLATLGFPYYGAGVKKITGLRQYGGTMSGVAAFVLTNQLRRSIGKTDISEDAPLGTTNPPPPIVESVVFNPGPPKKLSVTLAKPLILFEDTWARCFCKGRRRAHLIIAKVAQTQESIPVPWDVNYDCSVKPPVAVPAWTLHGVDFCTVIGGEIQIDTVAPGGASVCNYDLATSGINNATGWIIEFKLKVLASAARDGRLIFGLADGTYYERFDFSATGFRALSSGDSYDMDTTDVSHVYRFVVKGTKMEVFVDDALRLEVLYDTRSGLNRINFGDFSGVAGANSTSLWDYIKIYNGGDHVPDTELLEWEDMRYAQGIELPMENDICDVQLDFIGASGRFSAPGEIFTVSVRDKFPGGLWGSYKWNTYVWG